MRIPVRYLVPKTANHMQACPDPMIPGSAAVTMDGTWLWH